MNLKKQHIGNLLPILAGLLLFAHAVVPHHHHFGLTNTPDHKTTCESTSQDNNPEDSDTYCRAFNLLVSDETTQALFTKSLSENLSFHQAGINTNIEITPVLNHAPTFFDYRSILAEYFFFTAHSLRGPPAIV